MILVDADLLLYAEDRRNPRNAEARGWWDEQLSGRAPVCLCWTVLSAFIRIGTSIRIFERPLSLPETIARMQSWLDQPCVRLIQPTSRHWSVYREILTAGQATGNLVTDAAIPG